VLLRPPETSGWLPLLTGVALALALHEQCGLEITLKWPNDVTVVGDDGRERKVAGILGEATPDGAVVLGVGLNVTTRAEEFVGLPPGTLEPTSLALSGARTTDRETVLKATLRALARTYATWRSDPLALAPSYRSVCSTLGRTVRVELPGGATTEGTAQAVDDDGRLEVRDEEGQVSRFAAGDVIHLR
jgi:BirA family biotin operon repressor/biotin-[acetyl-CoA-carboxylase] ligase